MGHALTVQGIRELVREYFDLDSDDLPDRLVDRWVAEGWGKVVRYRNNWPGFEESATLVVAENSPSYPTPLKDIQSIEGPDRKLVFMSQQDAERRFIRGGIEDPAGTPIAYSVWRGRVRLWPTPNLPGNYQVRGYRMAINPLERAETDPLDLPHVDAEEMVLNWVMYRAALREDEQEQAEEFKDTFAQGMQLLAKDETDTPAFVPIVLNSQRPSPVGLGTYLPDRLRYDDGWD